ncbi:hypothetical protein G5C60_09215 [Streptomyces sp. HC44]|uniref:Uncharacterized protein n=1 Tax=Streptomyces scabichelini TaxID=2711217 RepID=A0A6G4V1A2_9ACTN|nr:hypothetical protein [Streptomyces scabichelini]NGO07828.1 hypothetical protein [Streptomyces scabichelini]
MEQAGECSCWIRTRFPYGVAEGAVAHPVRLLGQLLHHLDPPVTTFPKVPLESAVARSIEP